MKDQFANYVVQKILDTCTDKQREILLNRIRAHLQALKKYTYGKHIVARVEQLSGEGVYLLYYWKSNFSDLMFGFSTWMHVHHITCYILSLFLLNHHCHHEVLIL